MKRPSINHIYRLVWSESKNAYIPAAENSKTHTHPTQNNRLSLLLSGLLVPLLGYADALVVAPGSGATNVYNAPNGVPIINIDKANAQGLSHNKFINYNVGTNGVVLNNANSSQMTRQSQLAAQVMANTNLADEARIILNEVVAPNRSQLLGYTEVLGSRADVIVANPYGITCKGCGFINSDHVTITTGTPNINAQGSLQGFNINQGDILIQGSGIDATQQNYFDILSRTIKIDAQINAKELKIVAGSNSYDYNTKVITPIAVTSASPEVAIDSSALGGMYANRIKIVATEAGVGVKMLGEAAATIDDFILTSAGKIELKNKISAQRDISVTYTGASINTQNALEITQTSTELAAKRDLNLAIANSKVSITDTKLTAGENLTLSAASLSDTSTSTNNSMRFANKNMSLNISDTSSFSGVTWGAGANLSLVTNSLNAQQNTLLYSGSDANAMYRTLAINTHDATLNHTTLLAGSDLSLTSSTDISLSADSSLTSGRNLNLVATGNIATSATVLAGDNLTIKASDANAVLTNSGTMQAQNLMTLGESSHSLDITNNSVLLTGNLSVKAGIFLNKDRIQATSSTDIQADTFENQNSAKLFVSTAQGGDATLNISGSVVNAGQLQSAGQLNITTPSTLSNTGVILALKSVDGGNNEALNISSNTLTNSGTIDGGGALSLTLASTSSTALSNSGAIQSVDALHVSSGSTITNASSGKIISDASVSLTTNQSTINLTNTGTIQSGSAMSLGESGHTLALNNSGTLLAGTTLGLIGGAVDNQGTIQATSGATLLATSLANASAAKLIFSTAAGADGSLTLSSTLNNQGFIQSSGGVTLTSASTIDNSGTIKTSGNSDTLSLQATAFTNSGYVEAADLLNMSFTNTSATALNNTGQIHSVDALHVSSGSTITNASSGKIISDASVLLTTNQSTINLTNAGTIQSGSAMSLGESGHTLALNNSGTLLAGTTLGLIGGAVDNQGKIYATTGMTWSLGSLVNGSSTNSSAVILGAMTNGGSIWNISGSLSNYGALHSNDNLSITSNGLTNQSTGGISSLTALALNSTANIDNYGALYAGTSLSLTSSANIYNRANSGTIDSSGSFNSSSVDFTNNNTVVTVGNISISTTGSFTNETTYNGTAITKSLGGVENRNNVHEAQRLETEGSAYSGADIYVTEWNFDRQETLNGITTAALTALTKAQIIANGNGSSLTINYGSSGRNYLALLSAPTVNIGGSGTFTNEDLSLYKYSYKTQMIEVQDDYVGAGSGKKKYEFWGRDDANANYSTNVDGDHDEWGQYNPGGGWSRFNHGDTSETWDSAQSARNSAIDRSESSGAAMSGAVTTQSFGAGIYATNFNFTSGTLSNIGSPWPNDTSHTKAGNQTTGSVDSKSQSNATSSNTSSVNGAADVSFNSVNAVADGNALSARAKSSAIAGTTLTFAGLNLTLPSNPNGYFVVAKDPNAKYLVETNPLFAVGAAFVGSDYMAERYGVNPDTVVRRLGDASYEAYMVRQELIKELGTNLIRGNGDEASQMQKLMNQAVDQGKALGLTYGKPLTASQVANLKEDMIWMEEVIVGGEKVLAPHVYLSQATKDSILSGAAISAENVAISGDSLNNSGGTIQGTNTLSVNVVNDITNTSGTIQGGDISLTSTQGSIVNQTLAVGQGNDTQYSTTIGKTAGISATGNLSMDAKKDITVLGADVNAQGDASLSAGNNITFDTIVDKTTTSSSSSIDAGILYSSTTNSTQTTENNIGSNLSTVGKLKLKSGNDTVIGGSSVSADGGMDVDAGGSFKVEARQDKVTTTSSTDTTGIGVGGGVYGTESSTTDSFKGTNKGSTIQVGTIANQEKRDSMQKELEAKTQTLSTSVKELLSLKDEYLKSDKNSPESQELLTKLKSQFADYKQQLSDVKELQSQIEELPSGDLNVKAGEKFVLQGSDLNVYGNASIDAKLGIDILDGLDEERTKTTTTTTTFLKVDGEGTSSEVKGDKEANANANAEANNKRATASASSDASASASAETSSEHNLKLAETSTSTSIEGSKTSVASNFNVSGNLSATTEGKLTIQGSNLDIGGDALLQAKTLEVLSGKNETYSSTNTTTTSVGFYEESGANSGSGADASAEAEAKKRNTIVGTQNYSANAQAEANSEAEASADTTLTAGVRNETSSQTDYQLTNTSSTIKTGGNLSIKAKEKALFVGADVESVGDMTIEAQTIENKAAQDISLSTSTSTQTTAGLYLGGEASASANAGAGADANTGILGPNAGAQGSVEASADASAEVSAGIRAGYESESSAEGSVSNVTNSFKAGGNFKRTASDTILDQGTSIEAGGDIEQSAKIIKDEAIHDSTFSTTDTQSHEARVGVYAGAEASANANAEASNNLYTGPDNSVDAGAEASASAGVKVSYEGSITNDSSSSQTAVTSKYKAGGTITSKSTESTTLVGTQFEAGKDINIEAGTLDYQSAYDTTTASNNSHEIGAEAKVAMYGSTGVSGSGSYDGTLSGESSKTAQTGSLNAGGNIKIKTTKGDANFEGTNIEGGDKVEIQSTGSVNFNAAYDTTKESEQNINAEIELSKGGGESGASLGAGYEQANSSSQTAQTGSIKGNNISISASKDVTLEGTSLSSSQNTSIDAGGDVKLKEAVNKEDSSAFGVGLELGGSKDDKGSKKSIEMEANAELNKDVTSQTVSIQSGGKVNIKGKNIINQEADISSKDGTTLSGNVTNEKATDYSLNLGMSLNGSVESETKAPKKGSKTTDDIPDNSSKPSNTNAKKYASEAPELGKTTKNNQSPSTKKEEIDKLKKGWNEQKSNVNKVTQPKKKVKK